MRLFALLLLAGLPAVALDPRFVWETLDTPHFEVHYHQGTYRYAQRVARAAELSYQRLVPLLDHVPDGRTHIVVQDDTDFANGSASPILYNLIHAYAPPPDARSTLADFDDNVYELISHEYTHILHLDTVLGLPQAVNDVFGKLWITNGGQPIWFIEGMATFAESEVSAAGRVRASEEDMVLRAEVLEGKLPRIDTLSNLPLEWPRGFGQYTVGSAGGDPRGPSGQVLRTACSHDGVDPSRRPARRESLVGWFGGLDARGGPGRARRVRACAGIPGVRDPPGPLLRRSAYRRRAQVEPRSARAEPRRFARRQHRIRLEAQRGKDGDRGVAARRSPGPLRGPARRAGGQPALLARRRAGRVSAPPRRRLGRAHRRPRLARGHRRHPGSGAGPRPRLDARRALAPVQQRSQWRLQLVRVEAGRSAPGHERRAGGLRARSLAGRNAARARDLQLARIRRRTHAARARLLAPGHGGAAGRAASAGHGGAAGGDLSDAALLALGNAEAAFLAPVRGGRRIRNDGGGADGGIRRRGPARIRRHRLVEHLREGAGI